MKNAHAVLVAITLTCAQFPTASSGQAVNNSIAHLTVDGLDFGMKSAAEISGRYATDLGPVPRVGGFCPSMLDAFWKFPAGLVENCLTPSVKATLKKCNISTSGNLGAGVMTGAADCMSALVAQVDFSKPLDRATKALPDAVACMAVSVVGAAGLSPQEELAAKGVINGVKATYDEYQKLSKLAANLATGGPGVIPDFLAIDASGNDGDATALSVGDWLIEADKIAKDPLAYARAQTTDKVKTGFTSAVANAALNPTRTIEELQNWIDPNRPLETTDEMLRHCELPDAQIAWAARRAGLEQKIADARTSMEFYRKKTWCQITRGSQDFDNMSPAEKQHLIFGSGPLGTLPTRTNYERWQSYRDAKDLALANYEQFREDQAAFQNKYDARRSEIAPLLRESAELQSLARASVRKCTGTFVTQRTLNSGPLGTIAELNARVLDLKARMLGAGCSIPMANKFIDGIKNEIQNPYLKWTRFLSQAELDMATGKACSARGAAALQTNFNTAVNESFGSIPDMQVCLNTPQEKDIVGNIFSLATALNELDGEIANAGQHVAACSPADGNKSIANARKMLADMPCGSLSGAGTRSQILNDIAAKLALPNCGVNATDVPPKTGPFLLVYRVTGGGFVPHYAGGSYITSGHHDVAVRIEGELSEARFSEILNDALDKYTTDPCDAQVPAIPGLNKTPVIWRQGPQVEFIYGPAPTDAAPPLEDTWAHEEGDGPSLSELRSLACR